MRLCPLSCLTFRAGRTILGASIAISVMGSAAPFQNDVLIKGGTIYTGEEKAPFVGDVTFRGDHIAYVGSARGDKARRIIDAKGMIVAPGFIDAHTHPETYIRSTDPTMRINAAWLTQGVSTVVIGVDGYGTADVAKDSMQLASSGIGTNVVPFVGFGSVRQQVLGKDNRGPTTAELEAMKGLVSKAMCEGASGLSTGLFYAPQSFAGTDEVIALAREAGIRGGLYDTHQRDESSIASG